MKPAVAKTKDDETAFENLGRATLQIVHDLKNQLNGLKLYATYLRKQMEREDRTAVERETLVKLIAGLDRAARDTTALVRYAQPIELRLQPGIDLRKIISDFVQDVATRETGGLLPVTIGTHFDSDEMFGEFDSAALTQALGEITDDVRNTVKSREPNQLALYVRQEQSSETKEAVIEWRGANLVARPNSFSGSIGCGTVHSALGAKIIEAHGGRVLWDDSVIRAWLPLTNKAKS